MVVRLTTRAEHGIDGGAGGRLPFEPSQLLFHHHRRGSLAGVTQPLDDVDFSPSLSAVKRPRSGSSGSGSDVRSSRWNTPPDARARSAVIAETMLPAAPVTTNTVSGPKTMPSPPSAAGCSSRVIVHRNGRRGRPRPGRGRAGSLRRAAEPRRRPGVGTTSTAFTSAPGFSKANALAKPVTAPPRGATAPAAS